MAQNELSHPLQVILDGTNYIIRAQSMRIFLESRNLWLYMTGDLKKPTKSPTELDEAFRTRLIDWESNHHQILMWSRNSTIPSISTMFGNFDDSKSAWDMLAHLLMVMDKLSMTSLLACNSYGVSFLFRTQVGRILKMLSYMLHAEIKIDFINF